MLAIGRGSGNMGLGVVAKVITFATSPLQPNLGRLYKVALEWFGLKRPALYRTERFSAVTQVSEDCDFGPRD